MSLIALNVLAVPAALFVGLVLGWIACNATAAVATYWRTRHD